MPPTTAPPPTGPAVPASTPHAAIVCVADADASVQSAVRELLTARGAEVRVYGSGAGLLADLAGGLCPAAVVLDMHLPDMGGLELLRQLAQRVPAARMIVLTREAEVSTAVAAMRAGAIDFIEKPYMERALLKHVAPLLNGAAPAGA